MTKYCGSTVTVCDQTQVMRLMLGQAADKPANRVWLAVPFATPFPIDRIALGKPSHPALNELFEMSVPCDFGIACACELPPRVDDCYVR